jgi:hypothetical protein
MNSAKGVTWFVSDLCKWHSYCLSGLIHNTIIHRMDPTNYETLQLKGESTRQYCFRLLHFAIKYRINKASNYRFVADQIVKQDLIIQFTHFVPPPVH